MGTACLFSVMGGIPLCSSFSSSFAPRAATCNSCSCPNRVLTTAWPMLTRGMRIVMMAGEMTGIGRVFSKPITDTPLGTCLPLCRPRMTPPAIRSLWVTMASSRWSSKARAACVRLRWSAALVLCGVMRVQSTDGIQAVPAGLAWPSFYSAQDVDN